MKYNISGLDKRQCILQVSSKNKVRVAMNFRGSRKGITDDEKKACHPGVDVY